MGVNVRGDNTDNTVVPYHYAQREGWHSSFLTFAVNEESTLFLFHDFRPYLVSLHTYVHMYIASTNQCTVYTNTI